MIVNDNRDNGNAPLFPNPWQIAKRRRYVIISAMIVALAASLIGYASTVPGFVSEAVLVLDMRRIQPIPSGEAVVAPMPQDSPVLRTQLDIITSRTMASRVIRRLEREGIAITRPPEPGYPWERVAERLRGLTASWSGSEEAAAEETAAEAALEVEELTETEKINLLLSNLRVSNDGRSYTIFVTYRAGDPQMAAATANAFVAAFIDDQIEAQRQANRRVSDWLGETLVGLQANLEESESALESFRSEAGLIQANGVSLHAQALVQGNTELAAIRAQLASAEARLTTVQQLASEENVPALAEFLASASLQGLRAEQARIERALEMLKSSGAVKSRQVGQLTLELDSLRRQIGGEVGQVMESLANEVAIARQRIEGLEATLGTARSDFARANEAELTAGQLQREADANRTIYESYLVRYKQTVEQDSFVSPEAQVISRAEPAQTRAEPRLSNWLLLGLASGFGLAVAAAGFREVTDRKLNLINSLAARTDVPVLGSVPLLSRPRVKIDTDAGNTACPLGNALGSIRMALRLPPNSVVSITSSNTGDGKTMLALGLARAAGAAGLKAVVVDADLRDAGLAAMARLYPTAFVDEVLHLDRRYDGLIERDPLRNVSIVAARAGAVAPEQLLRSGAFRDFVAELRSRFDLVILDTPGVKTALDTVLLADMVDVSLFVVRADSDRLDNVARMIGSLAAAGHSPDGIVLNRSREEIVPHSVPGRGMGRRAGQRPQLQEIPTPFEIVQGRR